MSEAAEDQESAGPLQAIAANHPSQPIVRDKHGILRFKENAIVRYLLDSGPADMNHLAILPFSDEDRSQFIQLIGYSVAGYGDLSYISDDEYARAVPLEHT